MDAQVATISNLELAVQAFEEKLLEVEQSECPVIHRFSPGLYIREVKIPAGAFAIGHRQRYEHLNIFLKGRMRIVNEDGEAVEMVAPMIFTGTPGRKAGLALEDVIWLNIYPTTETDVETLESTYLDKSESWKGFNQRKEDSTPERTEDIKDYNRMLMELGVTDTQVRAESENETDQISMPPGGYKIAVSKSHIEGKGVFATAQIEAGEVIGPARIGDNRTPVGRYTNHSINPNAEMREFGDDIYLVAIKEIYGCRGGFLGDEITTDYRITRKLIGEKKCLV